ncbi:MAG TPA: HD domain-containing phosphohydrolase [Urbifossiella sp.]|nr:HD domain-containing phosphohydrolase [Urbifossiella sp.]
MDTSDTLTREFATRDGAALAGPGRDDADPVLESLARTEAAYRSTRGVWARAIAEAERARDDLAAAEDARRAAEDEVRQLRDELAAEREQTARQRERANRLAAALKDVHKALFHGNVYDLILKACMTVTGATRGVYLAARGTDLLRARAAADVDGYPRKEPSAFVRALAAEVLGTGKAFVANEPAEWARFPAPDGPGESFADCLVAPAVLLGELSGVVLLADKPDGFDDEDARVVMGIGDQAAVALENQQLHAEVLRAYFSIVGVLADAIEAKDPYTRGHSAAVARLARRTAARLTDSEAVRAACCYGGLLHDVGKIGVSDGVLNKPGKLQPEEWTLMQAHVRIGRDLLARVPALDGVAEVVLHHHERYDGTGYPDGLKGDGIPLPARIVGVVDAYSAMTARRSYKESMPAAVARAELERCKGSHFDPRVVDAFLAVLDEPDEEADCPDDGCGLMPGATAEHDFRHVVRTPAIPVPPPRRT